MEEVAASAVQSQLKVARNTMFKLPRSAEKAIELLEFKGLLFL